MRYIKLIILTLTIACTGTKENKEERSAEKVLNVYSHRHYDADKQAFEKFTNETGIKINLVKAGADELISRLEMEGENSPADVLITVDAAKLNRAKNMGLLQSVEANTNNKNGFIDADKTWYAITYRARVVAYDKEDVDVSELSTYEDLASDKWNDRILIRSSSSSYNQSLLSSIIHENGTEAASEWAKGMVENMAREPKGGDRDQIKAIASGVGDIAVVNTYYVGLLLNSDNPEEVKAGQSVGIYFPNQEGRGGHINISGVGVTKNAPNKENAIKFIEFLTSEEIQKFYAATSFEYPVHKNVKADSTVAAWGDFKIDNLEYAENPELLNEVIKIFDEAGWN
ncbi:iron(III) transport system substrate-binding protein [Ekhidna lutea]|uniref:Iron(III) transport system substrate-binding protein n=1 Tax=Ekhidna lutea TaxID=447679 RepID=A0A239KJC8_EKHLU|nr:extracellular solute-binding protein [Ekhidna lutea]SNT18487.1 iron(III) transport system substrate-binding protein [Ekhidna lutea]